MCRCASDKDGFEGGGFDSNGMAKSRRPPGPPPKRERVNEQIRITPVQVIDQTGHNHGPMDTQLALEMAREADLDLVEVAPNVRPPVCKIMDYGKFKYQKSKKESESKKNQTQIKVKEVRLSPKTETHDMQVKVNRARSFLIEGDKVQLTVQFKGREIVHKERGQKMLAEVLEILSEVGSPEGSPQLQHRRLIATIAPDRKKIQQYQRKQAESAEKGAPQPEDEREPSQPDEEAEDAAEDEENEEVANEAAEYAGAEGDDGSESKG